MHPIGATGVRPNKDEDRNSQEAIIIIIHAKVGSIQTRIDKELSDEV